MFGFGQLDDMLNKATRLSEAKAWRFVIDREVKDEIIRLITQDQLFSDGVDGDGDSLGEYSNFTKAIKLSKGQRIDHVTLKDTGAFYDSFRIIVNKDSIDVFADDSSIYDTPLTKMYGLEILGLTEENKGWLFDFLVENYDTFIRKELLQRI